MTLPVNHGRISYSLDTTDPFDVGTVATYSCNTDLGFGLTGDPTRTCVDGDRLTIEGMWDGVAPTCDCEQKSYNSCAIVCSVEACSPD